MDHHQDKADEHTIDIVNGKHILQVENMKNLLKENNELKQKLQSYVEEDFVQMGAKN